MVPAHIWLGELDNDAPCLMNDRCTNLQEKKSYVRYLPFSCFFFFVLPIFSLIISHGLPKCRTPLPKTRCLLLLLSVFQDAAFYLFYQMLNHCYKSTACMHVACPQYRKYQLPCLSVMKIQDVVHVLPIEIIERWDRFVSRASQVLLNHLQYWLFRL